VLLQAHESLQRSLLGADSARAELQVLARDEPSPPSSWSKRVLLPKVDQQMAPRVANEKPGSGHVPLLA